jgi:hypothetical protein
MIRPSIGIGLPLLVVLTLIASAVTTGAQPTSVSEVLARATDYVSRLHEQLSGMVSEERYEQRASGRGVDFRNDDIRRRVLRSDFLLVRREDQDRYDGFRDVFEVDGRAIRDRQDRLTKLFLDPSMSANRQIEGIRNASTRYNLGAIDRNFNTPTYALLFLHPSYKHRFEFERVTDAEPPLGLDLPAAAAAAWVLEYRETWPTTVIRGRDQANLPATGRFWVDPDTGRVFVTELLVDDDEVDATITVRYETEDTMDSLVPVEMRERYESRVTRIDGTATYTHFRRFQVDVEESKPFRD